MKTLWYPVSPPSRTARIECSLNTKALHVSSCAGLGSGRWEKSRITLMIFSGSIDRLYCRNVSSILWRYGVRYLQSAVQYSKKCRSVSGSSWHSGHLSQRRVPVIGDVAMGLRKACQLRTLKVSSTASPFRSSLTALN